MRIKEIAAVRVRYGYRRIHVLLKREGWTINVKRVYRLYTIEDLNLRNNTRRKRANQSRVKQHSEATAANECWAMDFVSDQLYDGKRFRVLALIDLFTRECLATYADKAIKGDGGLCGPPACLQRARNPQMHQGRQRAGVHLPSAGCLDLWPKDPAGILKPRRADRQRAHRIFQRQPSGRMPEHKLVHVSGRREGKVGKMAK